MSEEAPKKIEERLQRYAKERRGQGGDFSLHGATRRLLHGEVARQRGQSHRRRSGGRAWFGWWRRVAFGGVAVAVLVLTAWLVWDHQQSGQPMQLARNEMLGDREQKLPEDRALQVTEPPEEAGKRLTLARAPRLSDESRDSINLASRTVSLTPSANSSAGAQAPDFFSAANGASSSTNLFAYNARRAAGPNGQAVLPGVPAVQLSYFDNTKADQSGPAPVAQQPGRLAGAEISTSARFGVAPNDTGAFGGNALYANDAPAKEAKPNFANVDAKRLPESLATQQRSDAAKAQAESLALDANRPAADEGLARNRRMNVTQPAAAAGTQSKSVVDSLALADNATAAPAEAKAKAEVALNLPAQAAGELRGDASAADGFYRQAQPGQLAAIAQMEREPDVLKKAEKPAAVPPVLDRFTVEQQGNWLRIREPDGSVYEGPITEPAVAASNAAREKDALVREKVIALKPSPAKRDGEYSFLASGSNVTLRQMVVVNGRLSAVEDSIAPPAGAAPNLRPATVQRALTTPARGSGGSAGAVTNRISKMEGTVRVGTANEQPFKAVRAAR